MQQMQYRIGFLGQIDFLTEAPHELLERMAHEAESIAMPKGTVIFTDEEPGDAMYFIVDGAVRIEKNGQTLLTRRSGEYVGEMALIDDTPRSAAAVAATDIVCLRWRKDYFRRTLESCDRIAYQICRAFSAKIRESVSSAAAIKQDLERAVQLQRAMLPRDSFDNAMVTLSASCIQAEEIGGDYFDYLPFDDGQFALVMADAQGHGFAAALLVAMLKTRLHSQATRDRDPRKVMVALNQTLTEQVDGIQMATAVYVLFDSTTHELCFCSAGHIPQYHYRADTEELEILASENLILGFQGQECCALRTAIRSWSRGDLLVLFTDGLTEARNREDEEFGSHRVRELILRNKSREPREIRQKVLEGVRSFCGAENFADDVTLLVARLV